MFTALQYLCYHFYLTGLSTVTFTSQLKQHFLYGLCSKSSFIILTVTIILYHSIYHLYIQVCIYLLII